MNKSFNELNSEEMERAASYLAFIAFLEENSWALDFFDDVTSVVREGEIGDFEKEENWEVSDPVDWMKHEMKFNGLSREEALAKAEEEGVLHYVEKEVPRKMSEAQEEQFRKYYSKWSNLFSKVDSLKTGGKDFTEIWRMVNHPGGLNLHPGETFFENMDMDRLEREFGVTVSESEYGKFGWHMRIDDSKSRENKKVEILKDLQEEAEREGDDWTSDFLDSIIDIASKGRSPSSKQEEILFDKMRQYGYKKEIREFGGDPNPGIELRDREKEEVLNKLLDYAKSSNDDWLENFTRSIARQIEKGRSLSDKQVSIIERNLSDAGIDSSEADIFKNSSSRAISLKDELIRLGSEQPDLRNHLRPILDSLTKESGLGRGFGGGGFSSDSPDPYKNVKEDRNMNPDEIDEAYDRAYSLAKELDALDVKIYLGQGSVAWDEWKQERNWKIDQVSDEWSDALEKAKIAARENDSDKYNDLYGLVKNIYKSVNNLR
jgi:hypothetical protein